MNELEGVLKEHAKRYPLMQPRDAVKLIYQNEFGGGDLIRDEEACLSCPMPAGRRHDPGEKSDFGSQAEGIAGRKETHRFFKTRNPGIVSRFSGKGMI